MADPRRLFQSKDVEAACLYAKQLVGSEDASPILADANGYLLVNMTVGSVSLSSTASVVTNASTNPVPVTGNNAINAQIPTANMLPVLPCLANAAPPSYAEGRTATHRINLSGETVIVGTVSTGVLSATVSSVSMTVSSISITASTTITGTVTTGVVSATVSSVSMTVSSISITASTSVTGTVSTSVTGTVSTSVTGTVATSTTLTSTFVTVGLISGQTAIAADVGATGAGVPRIVLANNMGRTLTTASGTLSSTNGTITFTPTNRAKVYAISLTTTSATELICIFNSGGVANGVELWRASLMAPAGSNAGLNLSVVPPAFLFQSRSGTAISLSLNTATLIHYSLAYFDEA